MAEFVVVTTTVDNREAAERLSRQLVERRLAACCQRIGPIVSTYWWKGELETAEEWLLVLKTRAECFEPLAKAIRELHSYETPEIVATPIIDGSPDYLGWIRSETALPLSDA
ncbi:divalent-cation tolerance protein CutA [bacterium]|nr:divalent-cation tolerance protein CutA [bacterium]